jgi:hypothetical protein
MSAEKEIVNYWYNKKGFFTINNIKTTNNKDVGILALKYDKNKIDEGAYGVVYRAEDIRERNGD